MCREDIVDDAIANFQLPHVHQLLVRWAEQHPRDVFQGGFQPRHTDEDLGNNLAFNLEQYIHLASRDMSRAFVSTTRPQRHNGTLKIYRPVDFAEPIFAYEIYICAWWN